MSVSSLLDESTAAAKAMQMCYSLKGKKGKKNKFLVSSNVHPQTISLIQTRAEVIGIEVIVGDHSTFDVDLGDYCGAVVKYPNTYGYVQSPSEPYADFTARTHAGGAMVICATDLMFLAKLAPPLPGGPTSPSHPRNGSARRVFIDEQ